MENNISKTILKLVGIVVGVMVVLGVSLTIFTKQNYEDIPVTSNPKEEFVEPERYNVDMFMVGDALVHGAINYEANDQGSSDTYDYHGMLDTLKPILEGYDLAYYNQETIIGGDDLGISSYPKFNTPQAFGDYMQELGFNMINLANNHTLDKGEQGVLNSLAYWKQQEGIHYTGCAESWEDRENYQIFDINNIRFGFLGYTYGCNGLVPPSGKEYLVNIYDDEMLINDLAAIRPNVDVVVVSMHWGDEYSMDVSDEQSRIAHLLADNGADIIIGSHPHVIEPVEWIDDTICYYSLGNLFSGQDELARQIGMMGSLKITKSVLGDEVDITISQSKADLLYTYSDCSTKTCSAYKLYTFDELSEDVLPDYQSVYDEYVKVINQLDNSIIVGNIK